MKCPKCKNTLRAGVNNYLCGCGFIVRKLGIENLKIIWKRKDVKTIDIWEVEQLEEIDVQAELESLRGVAHRFLHKKP